jgi:hypothetical protein
MRRQHRATERFVSAVHRRLIVLHALESAGIGAAVASGLGAVMVLILIFQGRSAWELAGGMIALGSVVGLAWGIVKRPTRLAAAGEADRQLGLQDLLATAMFIIRANDGDAWGTTVATMADARCERLSPSTLVLNRLGARAWGGIGLALALVATLGVMSTLPSSSQARDEQRREMAHGVTSRTGDRADDGGAGSQEKPANVAQADGESSVGSNFSEKVSSPDDGAVGNEQHHLGSAGKGLSSGRSPDVRADPLTHGEIGRPRLENGQKVANGSGAQGEVKHGATANAGGISATGTAATAPPWRQDDWSQRRQEALNSLRSGRVPASYDPVIREYFDHSVE